MRVLQRAFAASLVCVTTAVGVEFPGPFSPGYDHPAIEYTTRPEQNAVSELNKRLQTDKIKLTFEHNNGYLQSILAALNIPIASQIVVFSRTSLQQAIIRPKNPRTIYFNDSVAVGWVPGEPFVEVAAEDRQQGVSFYTLDQSPITDPVFRRRKACLTCHDSESSLGVPGMLMRSVFPAPDGAPLRELGGFVTDHRSPYQERWGGWYVTGHAGGLRHLGNSTLPRPELKTLSQVADLDSLGGTLDPSFYLSPYSDVVALLIFSHQTHMINLLTRASWEVRFAAYEAQSKNGERASLSRDHLYWAITHGAHQLADYILFVDEPPLSGRIRGTSGFQEWFSA